MLLAGVCALPTYVLEQIDFCNHSILFSVVVCTLGPFSRASKVVQFLLHLSAKTRGQCTYFTSTVIYEIFYESYIQLEIFFLISAFNVIIQMFYNLCHETIKLFDVFSASSKTRANGLCILYGWVMYVYILSCMFPHSGLRRCL